jgi:L-fuconolactonase
MSDPSTPADRAAAHAAWLARTVEEPLVPDRAIVDPHHHLWDRPGDRYLIQDLHADTGAGHHVVQTVFVECAAAYRTEGPPELRPVGETEFVAAQAALARERGGAQIAGIVGFADLTLGDAVDEVLAAHVEAGDGLFRGIRHAAGWSADPRIKNSHSDPVEHLLADPAFRRGFARLGALGLRFDAWLYHPQLPDLVDLCRAHPEVPVILDHIGAPMGIGPYTGRRAEVDAEWRPSMRSLAQCPNVTLKVGGIGMNRYYGGGWPDRAAPPGSEELVAYWGDQLRFCIDTFGPDRCMFESNFPVDRESCSYVVLWNTFERIAADYTPTEQSALFHDTATRTYAL